MTTPTTAWYQRDWLAKLALVLIMAVLLYLRFPDMLPTGQGKVIEPYGDGYKGYTVIIYHAKYDTSYTHFGGMNYPYGDHVVSSATEPHLSNTLIWLKKHGYDLTDRIPDLIHYSILLSLILCAFFLFLIFRRLEVQVWYSLAAAVGITFLAPQFQRIIAHYGLSHPEVLPMLFYLLMRYGERPNLKFSLLIALMVWFYSLVHFYFFAISAFTVALFFLFWVLQKWRWRAIPMYALHFSLQILAPFLFFQYWINYLDPVNDRSKAPWGFMAYRGRPEGTFLSEQQPHLARLRDEVFKVGYIDFEAQTYLGLVVLVGLIFLLVRWFRNPFRIKPVADLVGKSRYLNAVFYTGLLLMLFGFGLPFTISGWDWLLEYAGPIRQFRSVSRFIWVFYFGSNIIIFSWLYHALKERRWAWAIWIPAFAVLGYEAYHFATYRDMRLDAIDRETYGRRFTDIQGINYRDYQAILTIPYCNIGSDQIAWECEGFIVQNALTLSLQTGLPTTAAMLTRTSISQTYNQYQLVMEPYRLPRLLQDLPDQRPFLVVFDVEKYEAERERYEHLLKYMRLIYTEGRLRLYELPLSAFGQQIEDRKIEISRRVETDSLLFPVNGFLYTDTTADFVYQAFDQTPASEVYLGAGAFQGVMENYNVFWDGPLPQPAQRPQRFYAWLYVGKDRYSRSRLAWEEYVPATGEVVQWRGEPAYRFIILLDKGWALLSLDFTPQRTDTHHRFSLQNKPLLRAPLLLDELLILPADQHLYRETADYIWMDNRWFAK